MPRNGVVSSRQPAAESVERIAAGILVLRGHPVMLSTHLAELYGVEPRVLVQAVKRNLSRFPADFMFELSREELADLKSQRVTSSWVARAGRRPTPSPSRGSRCSPACCAAITPCRSTSRSSARSCAFAACSPRMPTSHARSPNRKPGTTPNSPRSSRPSVSSWTRPRQQSDASALRPRGTSEPARGQGAVRDRSQVYNPKVDRWIKRDDDTGRFIDQKQDGDPFKGVRREKD